ncbi:LamG-like jellyroll fold domain-containing protein [Cohnella rhizosphaerae]|uniref:LamG domain-containing protein n=1 Tax=Cohnella rhizosphaerae TaxID=1457232 RepID=A0A9X4QW21_9BACL|nr:LamG-like jellyroll fold domain-containing protein [Cohnella rhizosphaerae]MDG0813956.1 LamG domain-containing protein [Cohnella rhizosphaerae]
MKKFARLCGGSLFVFIAAIGLALAGNGTASAATSKTDSIFSFDSTTGWWGDAALSLNTSGQKEGAGYFSESGSIVAGNLSAPVDVSEAQAFKLWVYISDASKLIATGPQLYLEFSHVENVPLQTAQWTADGLQTGWNEVVFYMADAAISNTKLHAIRFVRIRIDATAPVTFGLDDLRQVKPVSPTVKRIDAFETLTGHWGTGTLTLETANAPQGDAYVKVSTPDANNSYVIAGEWQATDLGAYAADGVLKLDVYVEDAAKLVSTGPNHGAVELHDSGSGVIVWDDFSSGLTTGWNELTLPLSQAASSTADLSDIVSFRFFQTTTAAGTSFGADDLRILNADAADHVVQMFPFDTTSGWWGDGTLNLATTGQKEGGGFVTTQDGNVIAGNLASTVDVSRAEALKLWVYISNARKLAASGPQLYFDITHTESAPLNTTTWTASSLQTGWNELTFRLADGASAGTDLSAIKFIHIRAVTTGTLVFGVDDLRVVDRIEPTATALGEFESLDGLTGSGTLALVSGGAPQGDGYVKVTAPDTSGAYVVAGTLPDVDLRSYLAGGIVKVSVYVEDAAKLAAGLNQGGIELHDAASGVIAWDDISSQLVTGWNALTLSVAQATRNTADWSNIVSFRFYQHTTATGTYFAIDHLRILNADYVEPRYANALRQLDATTLLGAQSFKGSSIYSTGGWKIRGIAVEKPGIHLAGTGVLEVSSLDDKVGLSKTFSNTDFSEYANGGYVYLWLYVSNPANIAGGQLELTSSTIPDYAETSWELDQLNLTAGWNELALPVASADGSDDANWSAINYFGIHAEVTAPTTLKLEGVYLGTAADLPTIGNTKPVAPRKPYQIDNMDSKKDWSGSTMSLVTTGAPEGKGYLSSTAVAAGYINFQKHYVTNAWAVNTFRKDLQEYKDSLIHLSVYVSDASKITGGQIELTSSAQADVNEVHWGELGTDIPLANGWNHLTLRFDKGVFTGNAPDLASLNCFRLYVYSTGAVTVGIDNLYAGTTTAPGTLTFDKGHASATGTAPTAISLLPGGRVALPASPFARSGYAFAGWSDGSKTYLPGAYYTLQSSDATLTAQWTALGDPLLANAVEAWALDDGGLSGIVRSELAGGTAAASHYGVWLNNATFGKVLDFSIAESYVSADADLASELSSGEFSVAAWIMAPVREEDDRTILASGNIKLYLDADGRLSVDSGAGTAVMSSTNLADGLWHHVLISYGSGTLKGYIDGTSAYSGTLSAGSVSLGDGVVIGANASHGESFDGSMAELRIYDAVKLPSQVTSAVIDTADNTPAAPALDLKKGVVIDRRQYWNWNPYDYERSIVAPQDIANIKALGFDHVKVLITPNWLIDNEGALIEERMAFIGTVLDEVAAQGFKAILCVHPEEGFKGAYMGGADKAAVEANLQPLLKWYGDFASYVAERWSADTVAIQLMTEPNSNSTAVSWDWIADRTWGAVRNAAPDHTIVTSSDASGNLERLKLMSPATDSNLIYSFTTYEPYTIGFNTLQSISNEYWKYMKEIPYPAPTGLTAQQKEDLVDDIVADVPSNLQSAARGAVSAYLDATSDSGMPNSYPGLTYGYDWHLARASSLNDWRMRYGGNIHIMSVEFGAMDGQTPVELFEANQGTGNSDATRIQLIEDFRKSFEAYDIGWSYWSYNESFTLLKPGDRKGLITASLHPDAFGQKVDSALVEALLGDD